MTVWCAVLCCAGLRCGNGGGSGERARCVFSSLFLVFVLFVFQCLCLKAVCVSLSCVCVFQCHRLVFAKTLKENSENICLRTCLLSVTVFFHLILTVCLSLCLFFVSTQRVRFWVH